MKKNFGKVVKLFAVPFLALSVVISGAPVYAAQDKTDQIDSMTGSSTVSFEYIKEKALKEGKALDINKYEEELSKSMELNPTQRSLQNQDLLKDYVVYSETVYPNGNPEIGSRAVSGDTRITDKLTYGAQTVYNDTAGDLQVLAKKAFEFAVGMTHPYVGIFQSVLGLVVNPPEYTSYNSTITRSLLDYVIITRVVEVYRNGIWEPMATSTKKNTSAQLNVVYYKGTVRYTPSNLNIGQISGQAAEYFYDTAKLTSLAKSTTSPLYYSYNYGAIVKVTPYFPF
ncbi:hypothetical protein [Paenibacillus antarcticus]|uniref:Uncharacterized protein n=1 Tax=Paenibacillus antarcticus TaxID=253703 RepID=A0A168R1U4_9BACL|nr:hypothetical protein [Paenibacillus antarcticus]OAB48477.1 hypothetical protein PBAT_02260 [Paenibacillus antarcticus]